MAHGVSLYQPEIDALALKYRGNVPQTHPIPYVAWWFRYWHTHRDACEQRYIARYVVWC